MVMNTAGLYALSDLIMGATTEYAAYCGIGTSAAAVYASDTDLTVPLGARKQVIFISTSSNVVTFETFYGASEGSYDGTWEEAGLFDISTSGNMYTHKLTGSIVKNNTVFAIVTQTITVT